MAILHKVFSNLHISSMYRFTSIAPIPHFTVRHSTNSNESLQQEDDQSIQNLSNPYQKEKRCCILCKYDVKVDYKNSRLLSQFLSPFTGKVYERNITGLCKTKQKIVEGEIIKAQTSGYLAIMLKKVEYLKDPRLCDPNRPVRPHRY